jgi:predicted phage baseplate assembly protein
VIAAPPIDSRTAINIARQVRTLLQTYTPDWKGEPGDFGDALVRIFARYAEIVIERLNRTPEKNLLAYLDLLGESLLPPQPAQAPLTFSLAAGSPADGVVPVATQVAAPPAEGDTALRIFETERELTVIAATLDKIFTREPGADSFSNLSPTEPVSGDRRAFRGTTRIDHNLYIGLDDLLGRDGLSQLRLDFVIDPGPSSLDPRTVSWSIIDGAGEVPIVPTADSTAGLAHTGQIAFAFPTAGHPPVPRRRVNEVQSRWLRGRLATAITPGDAAQPDRIRATHLPKLRLAAVSADLDRKGLHVDQASANAAPLDTTKDFFPFGERPRLGDAFCLSAGDAFAVAGAKVTLHVTLSADTAPKSSATLKLRWEYWDGGQWAELAGLSDGTTALTKTGEVTYPLGPHPGRLAVNGADGYWVRVRIIAGDYGHDASYQPVDKDNLEKGYKYDPPTFAPPSIAAVTADYTLTLSGQSADRIVTHNDFAYAEITGGGSFQPFHPTADHDPTLYLGFAPVTRPFPNRPVAIYFDIAEPDPGQKPDNPSPTGSPHLVWECWEGASGWRRPGLRDGTLGLTRAGVLEFLAAAGSTKQQEFAAERYWLRCRWEAGGFAFEPRLHRVILNTVMAGHTSTILDETMGSSDGSQNQRYVTTRRPVLDDRQELRVREPDLPSEAERKALEAQGGDNAIVVTRDADGRPTEIWVRWHEVPDFYGSGPRDRHYVLDHSAGTVSFGDGVNGLVPPPGVGNLRLARYRTGGGSAGNCAVGTIAQLKTTIPYVDKATNPEPARGGADVETIASLCERGPRGIRHRDRAVTIEDYEDLAMLASPEVARAKCVPLHDLSTDPDVKEKPFPGVVSVIIVPRSTDAKPRASRVLLERVEDYLDARRLPVVDLKIVRPDYVKVDVKAEIVLTSIDRASEIQPSIVAALRRFLHPLTGGLDAAGWDFGRKPHESDLLLRISKIPGIDHVRSLTVTEIPDRKGDKQVLSLVYAGNFEIDMAAGNA